MLAFSAGTTALKPKILSLHKGRTTTTKPAQKAVTGGGTGKTLKPAGSESLEKRNRVVRGLLQNPAGGAKPPFALISQVVSELEEIFGPVPALAATEGSPDLPKTRPVGNAPAECKKTAGRNPLFVKAVRQLAATFNEECGKLLYLCNSVRGL